MYGVARRYCIPTRRVGTRELSRRKLFQNHFPFLIFSVTYFSVSCVRVLMFSVTYSFTSLYSPLLNSYILSSIFLCFFLNIIT